ncbi:MAG: AmmeMemoRadiSam system radical SAM enzyme [Lachnospiraceae bacterium]|nr:AmmeMemoRadiSam system radical SAM enzyme [Lachnospiraceae bacterium]
MNTDAVCNVCPHHCRLQEGAYGICHARKNVDGRIISDNYGLLTSIMLDPIEKKPLSFFHPGSFILSVGSYGCNLSCPFCQNYEIATATKEDMDRLYEVSPKNLCDIALKACPDGNIGVAYTYNEALISYEYVRDCAKLIHEAGMLNVLVTNGTATVEVLEELLPYIDAMNIDLKCFDATTYKMLGGDFETVKSFIIRAVKNCHVELTTLIVPALNDSLDKMEEESEWIADIDPDIPLHITRYFPRYKMHEMPTDITLLYKLKNIAEAHLNRVLLGNI